MINDKEEHLKREIHEEDNHEVSTIIDLVDTFKNATGLQFIKEGAKWISTGIFMGTSDAIPGYSGGTTLAVLGFFKKLVLVAKSVFIPEPGITRMRALMFMIPFILGWVAGVFGFAKITEFLTDHNMGLELIFFFSSFILFAIPIFLKSEKTDLFNKEEFFNIQKNKTKKRIVFIKSRRWLFVLVGIIIVSSFSIWVFIKGGTPFHSSVENGVPIFKLGQNGNWYKLIGVAFLAGLVTIIPGGSGAIIQLLTGMYGNIHWKIMAHAPNNLLALFIFATSTFLGMLTMVFIMSWGLKKHSRSLASLSFGMLIASVWSIFLVPEQSTWNVLHDWKHILGVILAAGLGCSCSLIINWRVNVSLRKNKNKLVVH